MKKYLMFGVLIFLTAVFTQPVWSSGRAETDERQMDYVYVLRNQDGQHEQVLGGNSIRAYRGLTRAEERAWFIESRDPSEKPKDDVGDVVPAKKKNK